MSASQESPEGPVAEQAAASQSLAFQELVPLDMQKLGTLEGEPDAYTAYLADVTDLRDYSTNVRSSVLLDFFVCNLNFARSLKFTAEQASALFGIFKAVHVEAIDKRLNVDEAFLFFKDTLLAHANIITDRGRFYSVEEVKRVTEYAVESYFQHYKLYQRVFLQEQETEVTRLMVCPELPCTPISLAEFRLESEYLMSIEQARLEAEANAAALRRAQEMEESMESALEQGLPWLAEITEGMSKEEVQQVIAQTVTQHLAVFREGMVEQLNHQMDGSLRKIQPSDVDDAKKKSKDKRDKDKRQRTPDKDKRKSKGSDSSKPGTPDSGRGSGAHKRRASKDA